MICCNWTVSDCSPLEEGTSLTPVTKITSLDCPVRYRYIRYFMDATMIFKRLLSLRRRDISYSGYKDHKSGLSSALSIYSLFHGCDNDLKTSFTLLFSCCYYIAMRRSLEVFMIFCTLVADPPNLPLSQNGRSRAAGPITMAGGRDGFQTPVFPFFFQRLVVYFAMVA
jgi:hypothetical protein